MTDSIHLVICFSLSASSMLSICTVECVPEILSLHRRITKPDYNMSRVCVALDDGVTKLGHGLSAEQLGRAYW